MNPTRAFPVIDPAEEDSLPISRLTTKPSGHSLGLSHAACKISQRAQPVLLRDGCQRFFAMNDIQEPVRNITNK